MTGTNICTPLVDCPAVHLYFWGAPGEPSLCVYDTSGPHGFDVHVGLPALRREWIMGRGDVEEVPGASRLRAKAGRSATQLHYARQGVVTPEMEFIAIREGLDA